MKVLPGHGLLVAMPLLAALFLWPASLVAEEHPGKNDYQRPTLEETLAFLRTLPPVWRFPHGKPVLWQPWVDMKAEQLESLRSLPLGGHTKGRGKRVGPHMRINDEDWRYFTALPNLEEIIIADFDGVNDRSFYHLGHLSQTVRRIWVQTRETRGHGVRHLRNLRNLKSLGLCYNGKLTDQALIHVAELSGLEHLDLRGSNALTFPGLRKLLADRQGLPRLKSLKVADIRWLRGAQAKRLQALRPRLRIVRNPKERHFPEEFDKPDLFSPIEGSEVQRDGYRRPSAPEALAFLRTLPPVWKSVGRGAAFVQPWRGMKLEDFRNAKVLNVGGHVKDDTAPDGRGPYLRLKADDWRHFTAMTRVEQVVAVGVSGVNDRVLYHLGHLPQSVTEIWITADEVSGDGVKHLQKLKHLRSLGLCRSGTLTDRGLAAVGGIASLRELDLSGCTKITSSGLSALLAGAENLPRLKSLTLRNVPELDRKGIERFKKLRPRVEIIR